MGGQYHPQEKRGRCDDMIDQGGIEANGIVEVAQEGIVTIHEQERVNPPADEGNPRGDFGDKGNGFHGLNDRGYLVCLFQLLFFQFLAAKPGDSIGPKSAANLPAMLLTIGAVAVRYVNHAKLGLAILVEIDEAVLVGVFAHEEKLATLRTESALKATLMMRANQLSFVE